MSFLYKRLIKVAEIAAKKDTSLEELKYIPTRQGKTNEMFIGIYNKDK